MKEASLPKLIVAVVVGNAITSSIGEMMNAGPNVGSAITFLALAFVVFLAWAVNQSIAENKKK